MGLWSQVFLLLHRNWLIQKRRICVSIFELLLPVLAAIFIVTLRFLIHTDNYSQPTYYSRESVAQNTSFVNDPIIGYVPETPETDIVMATVISLIQNKTFNKRKITKQGFLTENDAIASFKNNSDQMHHIIVFNGVTLAQTLLPQHMNFTIRPYTGRSKWRPDLTFVDFQNSGPRNDTNFYRDRGVLYFQSLIGEAMARYWLLKNGRDVNTTNFDVYTNRMAYPPYHADPMIKIIQTQLPVFIILSFMLSVIINTKNIVYEKEKKLKESMKLMGLTPAAYWLSWFLTFSIYLVPAMALFTVLFFINISPDGPVLVHTNSSLFFVFLLCYALAMITFCFMISTFVQKANVGAAVSGILFFASYVPYIFIDQNYEVMDKGPKIGGSFLFNCAMSLGVKNLGTYEGTGEGAQWSNFHKPGTKDDNLSLLECMIMLLIDSAIHILITWYLDNVRPGEFGVPKPFYFCFTKTYWYGVTTATISNDSAITQNKYFEKGQTNKTTGIRICNLKKKTYWYGVTTATISNDSAITQNKYFEKGQTNKATGIRICNLKKKFGKKVAVAGTTLNMYEGQITVLLGHNGAGKTTTMSMLTGFIPPTSGTAFVNDCDIRDNIAGVRKSLGLCPQHNILFDTLTVMEHLRFFAKLKGCSGPKMEKEIKEMVRKVDLQAKVHTMSQFLSGGQKRKLSVGIALIGGSKIVILDEPTSGMDPAARRQTWNVLQEARQGRTLVLSTHYMDEADLLGDRIAIMAGGVVKCCGSSMFLKKSMVSAGYHLVVVRERDCNVNSLTQAIQSFVPTSQLETIINTEVSYHLPDNESKQFPALFHYIEGNKEKLGITSFGTSATTMEEVFLKVGDIENEEDTVTEKSSNDEEICLGVQQESIFVKKESFYVNPSCDTETTHIYSQENTATHGTFEAGSKTNREMDIADSETIAFNKGYSKKTGISLEISRIYALFVKKAIHTWRNRTVTLTQFLLPVIFTALGMAVEEVVSMVTTELAVTFDLSPFGATYIPYRDGINATTSIAAFTDLYRQQFGNFNVNWEYCNISEYATFDNCTVKLAHDIDTPTFNKKMIIGMEVIDVQSPEVAAAVAFYNGQPLHAEPISVNYLMNTFLQNSLNDSFSLQSSINPLPKDEEAKANDNILKIITSGFSIGFFIPFGMSFLTTLFIYFLIKERQVGAKHMQVLSGVGPLTYWLPTFMWDFINYIVPSLLLLVVFAAFNKTAFLDDGRWALVILVLVLFGWAVLTFIYLFQFAFNSPSTGVAVGIMLSLFSGLFTTLAVFVLKRPDVGAENVANALDLIFMIAFPIYNLATCFININTNYMGLKFCQPYLAICSIVQKELPCCKENCGSICLLFESSYLSIEKPGIGTNLFIMAIQGVVCSTAVMLIEYHVFQKLLYLIRGHPNSIKPTGHDNSAHQVEDNDIAAERERINSTPASVLSATDSLILVNLYKQYKNVIAVDHICVGIPEQECFGLLGQNGAGKTSTFKMLTGDVMITGGNAYLKGFDVKNNIKQVQANMGYCPQFDALIDQMTGRETLTMYARLRGIPEDNIKEAVNTVIDSLMLRSYADKLAGQYSGGNKRKLSTAMALIGDPRFIILDEPSSGMDPKARRNLWTVLSQVRASGRTLVLTSHSMEECDALCTRLAIMVNGRLMCLGSPQHLKNKFGQGYTLITQLGTLADGTTAPNQPVINYITSYFPDSKVFDDHQGYVHFQVPDTTIKLADVFAIMEQTKENLHVDDYSVQQTTLEQIFLTFTRDQTIRDN